MYTKLVYIERYVQGQNITKECTGTEHYQGQFAHYVLYALASYLKMTLKSEKWKDKFICRLYKCTQCTHVHNKKLIEKGN